MVLVVAKTFTIASMTLDMIGGYVFAVIGIGPTASHASSAMQSPQHRRMHIAREAPR